MPQQSWQEQIENIEARRGHVNSVQPTKHGGLRTQGISGDTLSNGHGGMAWGPADVLAAMEELGRF